MGRRKSVQVFRQFQLLPTSIGIKKKRYKCSYCDWTTCHNSTRMKHHILQCKNCPRNVKQCVERPMPMCRPTFFPTPKAKIVAWNQNLSDSDDKDGITEDATGDGFNLDANAISTTFYNATKPRHKLTSTSYHHNIQHSTLYSSRPNKKIQRIYSEETPFDSSVNNSGGSMHSFPESGQDDNQEMCNGMLCRAIYGSGTPMNIVENSQWQALFEMLYPAWKMPLLEDVTEKYLDSEHATILRSVNNQVSEATSVGLLCDGWTNEKKQGCVNIVLTTPEPVFYKRFSTITESLDATYIFECISQVLKEVDPYKVFGIVTDNSASMKAAWTLIRKKHTHVFPYGCVVHGLHQLAQDIVELPGSGDTLTGGTEIVREILKSNKLNAILLERQVECNRNISLVLPESTQWSLQDSLLETLLMNKDVLTSLANDSMLSKFDEQRPNNKKLLVSVETKQKLLDDGFWENVTGLHSILQAIMNWINIMKNDRPQISLVCEIFDSLKKSFVKTFQNYLALQLDEDDVFSKLQVRSDLCVTDLHRAANLLDPLQRGSCLTPAELIDAIEFIDTVSSGSPEVDDTTVFSEFALYRSKEGVWSKSYIWQAAENVSADTWWKGISPSTDLSKIACKILNSPPTAATCDHTFGSYEARDQLSDSRATKLAFVEYNLKFIESKHLTRANRSAINAQSHSEQEIITDMANAIIEIYDGTGDACDVTNPEDQNEVEYEEEEWLMEEENKEGEQLEQESLGDDE